jgi:hypothetical protein
MATKKTTRKSAGAGLRSRPDSVPKSNKCSENEANTIYEYWANGPDGGCRPVDQVARKFGRTKQTVYRLRKLYKWDDRYRISVDKAKESTDKRIEVKKQTTRDIIHGAMVMVAEAMLESDYEIKIESIGQFSKLANNLASFGRIMLELDGQLSPEGVKVEITVIEKQRQERFQVGFEKYKKHLPAGR